MIFLRQLKKEDASLMIEWMHDPEMKYSFKKNMSNYTISDAEAFCEGSIIPDIVKDGDALHFAIVSEDDEYLGTVSLKEIDMTNKNAEYAIVLRRKARGLGIAKLATEEILDKAFNEYNLNRVYLNVLAENAQAIKLYEKCGFVYEGEFRKHLYINGEYVNWKWYGILKDEYDASYESRICN